MAVVRSLEGTFYDVPDGELEKYKVPADQVKGLMEAAGQRPPQIPALSREEDQEEEVSSGGPAVDSLRSLSSSSRRHSRQVVLPPNRGRLPKARRRLSPSGTG